MACLPGEEAYGALRDGPKAGAEGGKESSASIENFGVIWFGFVSECEGVCGGTGLSQMKST